MVPPTMAMGERKRLRIGYRGRDGITGAGFNLLRLRPVKHPITPRRWQGFGLPIRALPNRKRP